jgi:hypothetical protein
MRLKTAVATVALVLGLPVLGLAQTVSELVDRNAAARGGTAAWRAVSSLRLSGRMDLGRGMMVPYTLEQKRPNKMRLEFVFDRKTAVQSTDGKTGWKISPFLGRTKPEPMTEKELRDVVDIADPYGLLFDYAARGHIIEFQGHEQVEGKDAFKLKVTLPGESVRWVYLDAESGLDVKIAAMRTVAGRKQRVETFYRDWKPSSGILIPHRQETRTEGERALHLLTVESVLVNPPIDDSRFAIPDGLEAAGAHDEKKDILH